MAAIIAQMAANNRERRRRIREKDFILPPSKSNYVIPPFEPCFDPKKHNQYLKMKEMRQRRAEIMEKAKARAIELKKQEDYKLVIMLWNMKKEMPQKKFSMDWVPTSAENIHLASLKSSPRRRSEHISFEENDNISEQQMQMENGGFFMKDSTRLIFDIINSLLGIFGISIFIIIFIALFVIFGNIDGKPWTTVFKK